MYPLVLLLAIAADKNPPLSAPTAAAAAAPFDKACGMEGCAVIRARYARQHKDTSTEYELSSPFRKGIKNTALDTEEKRNNSENRTINAWCTLLVSVLGLVLGLGLRCTRFDAAAYVLVEDRNCSRPFVFATIFKPHQECIECRLSSKWGTTRIRRVGVCTSTCKHTYLLGCQTQT